MALGYAAGMQYAVRRITALTIAAFLCGTLLAGCAGGGAAISPVPGTNPVRPAARDGHLTIRIVMPKKPSRRVRYISRSTKSIEVTITGTNDIGEFLDLTKSTTLSFDLKPGRNWIAFTCYDSTEASTANVLSIAQKVPFNVVAGKKAELHVTLAAVPATLYVNDVDGDESDRHISLNGPGAYPFTIVALDADNNTIIGPGAPTYSVKVTGAPFTVTQPTSTAPNTFYVSAGNAPLDSDGELTVTAGFAGQQGNGCAVTGAQCMMSAVGVSRDPLLLVADATSNSVESFGGAAGASFTIPIGSNAGPIAMTEDREGDLYVANSNLGNVAAFAPPYYPYSLSTGEAKPTYVISGVGTPSALLVDAHDNLYVLDTQNDYVYVYAHGSKTPSFHLYTGGQPYNMALDARGDLAVSELPDSYVEIFQAPLGSSSIPTEISEGIKYAYSVAFDTSSTTPTLYVANSQGVQPITYSGVANVWDVGTEITSGVDAPFSIAVNKTDPLHQNYLFVANHANSTVTEYQPGSTSIFATYPASSGIAEPESLAFDASGNLYVGNGTGNVIAFPAGSTTPQNTYGISQASALLWVP